MTYDIVTDDWKNFGHREIKAAIELLNLYNENKMTPVAEEYMGEHLRPMLNRHSGWVFLTDDDNHVFLANHEGLLDIFLSCPNCGNEGFPEELIESPECEECKEFATQYTY